MKHTRFPSSDTSSIETSSYYYDNTKSEYLNNAHFMDSIAIDLSSQYTDESASSLSPGSASTSEYFYISRQHGHGPKHPRNSRPKSKYFSENRSIRIDDSDSDFQQFTENSYSEITRTQELDTTGYLVPKKCRRGYFQTMPSTSSKFQRNYAISPDECYYTDEEATRFMNITEKIYENIEDLKPTSPRFKKICDEGPVLYGHMTMLVFNEAYANPKPRRGIAYAQSSINQLLGMNFYLPLENVTDETFHRNCFIYGMHITNQLQLTQKTSPDSYVQKTKELHEILTRLKNASNSKSFFKKIRDKIKKFCS